MPQDNVNTALGFDVGLKRTGVAIGNRLGQSVRPLTTIETKQGQLQWDSVEHLLNEWQPDVIIIGDPKTDNPHLNKVINRLSHFIQQRKIPIVRIDETLTSASANSELAQHAIKRNKKIQLRDQVAACIIIESYFQQLLYKEG